MLTPRVIVLHMQHHFMKNYNYLVVDPVTIHAVMVHQAWEMKKIDHALADAQARLSGVLLTHSHPDHIDLAEAVAEKYGCPIWMSPAEIAASGFSARGLAALSMDP